jgi:hypothetical protein
MAGAAPGDRGVTGPEPAPERTAQEPQRRYERRMRVLGWTWVILIATDRTAMMTRLAEARRTTCRRPLRPDPRAFPAAPRLHLKRVGRLYLMNTGYFLSVLVVDRLLGTCPAHRRDTGP